MPLLAMLVAVAGCGSDEPVAVDDPEPSASTTTTAPTTPTTETTEAVESVPETTVPTTEPEPSSTSTEPPTTASEGLAVIAETDRNVAVTSVVMAKDNGLLLATIFDPDSLGCEGIAADYLAVVGSDGTISPTSIGDQEFLYPGSVDLSPNRRQLLDVNSCEGFLGSVTVYDVETDLEVTNPVQIDTQNAISGDASWNADGFITMILSDQPPFFDDPTDEVEPEVRIEEFLVNPRTGESTLFGTLDTFSYGTIRTPGGVQIYSEWGPDPAVVLVPRNSSDERRVSATDFALSPDASQLAVWDSILDAGQGGRVELLDMDTGTTSAISEGRSLRVVWRGDSSRLAFSVGGETLVHDLGRDETVSVGSADPLNCTEDDYITWGRIPLAFTPKGDLLVGDPVCVVSSDGFPSIEYQVHQLSLS